MRCGEHRVGMLAIGRGADVQRALEGLGQALDGDDQVAFAEHPDLPGHWRHRGRPRS